MDLSAHSLMLLGLLQNPPASIVDLTAALAIIAFLQLLVYGYQAKKLRETVESAGEQSKAMERHIDEAARSADAMEKIVATIRQGNEDIMRAYLTVTVGTALYQMRRGQGQVDLKFEARPHLVNSGGTQARKVLIRGNAGILPLPIPNDFGFPVPEEDPNNTQLGTVGAHQTHIVFAGLSDFVPDEDVQPIKEGAGKAFCAWGIVTYEDIFGKLHAAKFGQILTWMPDNTLMGYYIPGQNDGD